MSQDHARLVYNEIVFDEYGSFERVFFYMLQFATRAKTIKNKPHVNEVLSDAAMLKKYRDEITRLKRLVTDVSLVCECVCVCVYVRREKAVPNFMQVYVYKVWVCVFVCVFRKNVGE